MAPPLGWWNVVGPYRDEEIGGVVSGGGVALRVVSNSVGEKLSGVKGVIGGDSMDVDGGATFEGSSRFSRMSKLEFPKFYGDNVQGWMFRVKQFFSLDVVHEEDKIKMVSIHLHDKALTWRLQFVKNHGETVSWNVYEKAILKRFGYVYKDPMAELKNPMYETSMKEYQSNFERFLNLVDITKSQSISMFIAGLPAAIEYECKDV
ncbi:putative mitochondrial protein [Tanacetum coccineum]